MEPHAFAWAVFTFDDAKNTMTDVSLTTYEPSHVEQKGRYGPYPLLIPYPKAVKDRLRANYEQQMVVATLMDIGEESQ